MSGLFFFFGREGGLFGWVGTRNISVCVRVCLFLRIRFRLEQEPMGKPRMLGCWGVYFEYMPICCSASGPGAGPRGGYG